MAKEKIKCETYFNAKEKLWFAYCPESDSCIEWASTEKKAIAAWKKIRKLFHREVENE